MLKIICVYSQKGGVGKSTILVNIINKLVNKNCKTIKYQVINTDMSSYSIRYMLESRNLLKFIDFTDDKREHLPGYFKVKELLEKKYKYIFIDMVGQEMSVNKIKDLSKGIDFWICPLAPVESNISTIESTFSDFKEAGLEPKSVLAFVNILKTGCDTFYYNPITKYLDSLIPKGYIRISDFPFIRNIETPEYIITKNATLKEIINLIK